MLARVELVDIALFDDGGSAGRCNLFAVALGTVGKRDGFEQ